MITIEIILTMLYTCTAFLYTREFFKANSHKDNIPTYIFWATFGLHFIYLIVLSVAFSRIPVASFAELLSALAFGLLLISLYLEFKFQTRAAGPWVLGMATVVQIASVFLTKHPTADEILPIFTSTWLPFHILFGVLANAAILVSAVFSMMYLLLYRSLKLKKFDQFFQRFPPLATIGEMNYQALLIGVTCYSLLFSFGYLMMLEMHGKMIWDFKFCMFFTSYVIYISGVLAGLFAKWRGNRLAIFSLLALCALIISIASAMSFADWHLW